jgi:N-acetylmuramoyl-L-alanine amidase
VLVKAWPRPDRKVQRIVLDPGHGGKDPGAVGRQGTMEKTIVFDVTRRVKHRLEEHGFDVLLTRTRDEYVPLGSRSEMANEYKADVFVSIHANAAENRDACGFETFFLSVAKTDWERAVAARENAVLEYEMPDTVKFEDELELILADLAQNEFLTESSELAACIQEHAVPCARVKDRGVKQANFFVLRNNYMPAVLVECGFISNKSEEKLLLTPKHRERIASGVADGIIEFIRQYERKINGT